jgi:hypothetical protein
MFGTNLCAKLRKNVKIHIRTYFYLDFIFADTIECDVNRAGVVMYSPVARSAGPALSRLTTAPSGERQSGFRPVTLCSVWHEPASYQ